MKAYNREEIIKQVEQLKEYEVISKEAVEEMATVGIVLRHKKTSARVLLLPCDDDNKVFYIGFRTPPTDSTGVAHIVEHTVLCGSDKFPSKDPFVELVKGSLNTFLNAMTYPDKTVYPIASCNEKDFRNLCDVYLDSVFHPNIYKEEKIFKQEGWHFELDKPDGELKYNGVVYNEMKGVYSSSDGVMEGAVSKTLFKGHTYGEESGGDPDVIPELTYEDYLNFHSRYYHPSNSYIYLYGDDDMAETLTWMDREYLSHYDELKIDSKIPEPTPLKEPAKATYEYSISDGESEEHATDLSIHTVVGCELDPVKYMGFKILEYILIDMPGAPLREALQDAGICDDVTGGYQSGIRDPYFSVIAKNSDSDRMGEFLCVVKGTLRKLAEEGIDKESLLAAINVHEFRTREADYGQYPKGLMYGLATLDSWLYDADPVMHLKYEGIYKELRAGLEQGFFEGLISEYLLDNPYEAYITLKPVRGLADKKDIKLAEKLSGIKAALSTEDIERIIRETAELKEYQSTPSDKEDLLKIPMLKRSDISKEAESPIWELRKCDTQDVIYSRVATSGIAYLKLIFNAGVLSADEIPYMTLLKDILGYIDTEKNTYAELSTLTNMNTGGIGFSVDSYPDFLSKDDATWTISANAKTLYDKIDVAMDMIKEMLLESKLHDTKRIKDIIGEVKAASKDKVLSGGHVSALNRAGSHMSKDLWFSDMTKGIGYYKFLESISEDYDSKASELADKLTDICKRLFTKNNLTYNIVCDDAGYDIWLKSAKKYAALYPDGPADIKPYVHVVDKLNEAYTTASMVNYVAAYGNYTDAGYNYRGTLKILKVLLSYDYLWNHIRVLGGAYGCSAAFARTGGVGMASYRDPKLAETYDTYAGISEFVKNYDADEREMTKAIIGAISELDTPQTPLTKGMRGLSAYYSHITAEQLQKERDEILNCTAKDIQDLAPMLKAAYDNQVRCTVGSEAIIKKDSKLFDQIMPLYK